MGRATRFASFLFVAILWVAGRADAEASDALSTLLAKLSRVEAVSAHFREEKRMALLSVPLVSEGDIYYQKPRALVRHTRKPMTSSLLLEGSTLKFGDKAHVETASLTAQPAISILVDAFMGVLSGDKAALEREARVTLESRPSDGWRILVTPNRDPLQKLVRSMEFEGAGSTVSRMRLVDANGDETVTTFTDVRLRGAFDAAERARLFRIGG